MPKMSAAEKVAAKAAAEPDPHGDEHGEDPWEVLEEYADADGTRVGVCRNGEHVDLDFEEAAGGEAPLVAGRDPAGPGLAPGFEFEMVPVEQLSEHPKNANRGDVDAIGRSVSESGFYGAVVAQRSTGYILAGNHRYRVARERGLAEVPVTWVDVDAIGAVRILLADNEIARRGRIDLGAQDALLQELREVDPELKGTGFDTALEELAAAEAEAEAAAEAEAEEAEPQEFGARYGVIVMCESEAHQAEVYAKLEELQLGELRVVAV